MRGAEQGGAIVRRSADMLRGMAEWAEAKADEAAASDAPWALGNLRVYQNMASKYWGEHFAAARDAERVTS